MSARATARARALGAEILDLEGEAREGPGPLRGWAISIKDNIAVSGHPTTAGCQALAGLMLEEGAAVGRLRAAGARITAKTNLHELAFGITGDNPRYGTVGNPFAPGHIAGGSSSGGAVFVAVGASRAALVTDTGGSARIPAAFCGVVGFRPSTGRVPADGMVTLSPSRDTIGIIAGSVADVAAVDAVLALDAASPSPRTAPRLGVIPPESFGLSDYAAAAPAFAAALARLEAAGFTLVPVDATAAVAADAAIGLTIAGFETARSLDALARARLGLTLSSLTAAIESPDVQALVGHQAGPEATPEALWHQALATGLPALRHAYAALFEAGLDALVCPTVVDTAPARATGAEASDIAALIAQFLRLTTLTRADSMAGLPSISLPMGLAGGLPLGLQLIGSAGQDRALLALAQRAEAALPPRPHPPEGASP
jgi:mandelamide amidase